MNTQLISTYRQAVQDMIEIFQLREAVEGMSVRLATQNIERENGEIRVKPWQLRLGVFG